MTALSVYTVQAFSNLPTGGNGAGVVIDTLKKPGLLTEKQMLAIAKHMGFSETAFVFPSDKADFQVRFFTSVSEVNLCGHATIATFKVLLEEGLIKPGHYQQETLAGILDIDITDSNSIFMTQTLPQFLQRPNPQDIVDSLNLKITDLHPTLPIEIVSTGLPDIIVPLKSLTTLQNMRPDFEKVNQISEQFDTVGYHIFTLETLNKTHTAHCRNLAPRFGIDEEAATGTANGALSAYLYNHGVVKEDEALSLNYEQGHILNSPSEIKASLSIKNKQINQVQVGGTACITGNVQLTLSSEIIQRIELSKT